MGTDTQTIELASKRALVLGLGPGGRAAGAFLRRAGAQVTAAEPAATGEACAVAAALRALGAEVVLGAAELPSGEFDFHDLGPVLSERVKRAFLVREVAEKIRAAWSLFTPCTLAPSLVEAVAEAARSAVSGDVVLLSPACSSLDQFQDYQKRGECFCRAVKSIGWGVTAENPKIGDTTVRS